MPRGVYKHKIGLNRRPMSDEQKIKIGLGNSGKIRTEEAKEKNRQAHLGKIQSADTREKNRQSQLKRFKENSVTNETREKIRQSKLGDKNPAKRPEVREKMRQSKLGKNRLNWYKGLGINPYSIDWTKTLRISIRERDHYTCQLCREKQGDVAFSVHHIDYNKQNCNSDNLITLCVSCHTKTNYNREYWIKLFNLK